MPLREIPMGPSHGSLWALLTHIIARRMPQIGAIPGSIKRNHAQIYIHVSMLEVDQCRSCTRY
jgi:hypothetical protein